MQCERLIRMIKSWYIHVREETMAPARMVSFMEQHIATCDTCLEDPDVKDEVAKITEMVLPESKIPKAVRQQQSIAEEAAEAEVDEDEHTDSDDEHNDIDDEEEEEEALEVDDDLISEAE